MGDNKISEAVEAALNAYDRVVQSHAMAKDSDAMRAALAAALPHLHPQPAELAEQQEVELPPLPPVDGYDKRVHGHYSAEQMRDYARNAIRSAKQEQACSGLGIDKMAKELLERHTVAVPVAVEDGRCFMVREQDALDAIRAALSATGKQQVGEVQGDAVEHAKNLDLLRAGYHVDAAQRIAALNAAIAALAARQPVEFERAVPTNRRESAVNLLLELGFVWNNQRWEGRREPGAQGMDLEQFREAVNAAWKASMVGSEVDLKLGKLLALIDGQAVQ